MFVFTGDDVELGVEGLDLPGLVVQSGEGVDQVSAVLTLDLGRVHGHAAVAVGGPPAVVTDQLVVGVVDVS